MKRGYIFLICALLFCGFLQQEESFVHKRYEDVADYMKARKRLIQAELAMNSLIYSAMNPEEKERALEFWRGKWAKFITWLNEYHVQSHSL